MVLVLRDLSASGRGPHVAAVRGDAGVDRPRAPRVGIIAAELLDQGGEPDRENEKECNMKKAASRPKVTRAPAVRVHKLDSTNPQLKYLGGSNFDAWNNTIARQATNSVWHGHNAEGERIHEREVASLSLLAGISPNYVRVKGSSLRREQHSNTKASKRVSCFFRISKRSQAIPRA
jgi:hypothetical protein